MRAFPCAALLLLLLAPASWADLWQWTDSDGVVRYTPDPDRVPSDSRGALVKVEPGMPPAAAVPARPADADAMAASGGVEADPFNAPKAARSVEVTEIPEPAWATGAAADPTPDASAAADGAAATPSSTSPSGATPTPPPPAPVPEQAPEPTPPVSSPPPAAPTEVAVATPPAAEPPAPDSTAGTTATPLATAQTAGVDPWTSVTTSGSVALPAPPSPAPPAPLTPEQRSRREELEARIAQDEEALKRLLSDTDLDAADFEQSPELREIARRLPALQAELRALEDGRAAPEVAEEP